MHRWFATKRQLFKVAEGLVNMDWKNNTTVSCNILYKLKSDTIGLMFHTFRDISKGTKVPFNCCTWGIQNSLTDMFSGARGGTVLQNIYSADIISWLAKSADQIMDVYKCSINLYIFKIFKNKYVAIFIIMHILQVKLVDSNRIWDNFRSCH